jgi:hypothetical protein
MRQGGSKMATPFTGGKGSCVRQWWQGELERVYALHRAKYMHELSVVRLHVASLNVPDFLESRVLSHTPLPRVELADMPEEATGGGIEGQGGGHEEERRRAVATFVIAELSRELYLEFLEVMRPW